MNNLILYTTVAFIAGTFAGVAILEIMSGGRKQYPTPSAPASADDTALLDYLEGAYCNLFYNTLVDGGAWGFLGGTNDLIAVGKTVRDAIKNARDKDMAASGDLIDSLRPVGAL